MADLPQLTLDGLERAVAGEAAALRCITRLQPAGGEGDKIFPPTYTADKGAKTRYAFERRRVNGQDIDVVLLDSVASQANRMEEALLGAWEEGRLDFPVIAIDFTGEESIADLDRITTLQAPHRIADALLRDSVDEHGTRFRETPAGRAYTDASAKNATAIYLYCPTALLFGVWDSTGPRGGLGNKIQRALVAEIVGIGAVAGAKTASRLDPAGIQANVDVYHRRDNRDEWTTNPDEALIEKGKPVPFSRKGTEGKGKPSAINHSNVAPTIDITAGGVTFDYAVQTVVLSFPALRRLRFLTRADSQRFEPDARPAAERAARAALAALGVSAVAEQRSRGFDLRSRSLLVPEAATPTVVEVVASNGGASGHYAVSPSSAAALLAEAAAAAARHGLPWQRQPLGLRPAPKLAALIRESRKRAASGEMNEAEVAS
jgi:CRISPR-associated protein Csb1